MDFREISPAMRGRWPFHRFRRFRRRGFVEGAPDIGPEQRQGLVEERAVGVLGWWMDGLSIIVHV